MRIVPIICLVALIGAKTATAQRTLHVDASAAGANDGTSWTDAFTNLQDALATAAAEDQLWVARGTYTPDRGAGLASGDRSESFRLVSGVRVLGGFTGIEERQADRDPEENPTILSGDLQQDDHPALAFRADNAFHVVTAVDADANTLLDGFYVTGGHADGADADSLGGGIRILGGAPAIMNTFILDNYARCGGGMSIEGGSPEIVNVVFDGNEALSGGAMCNLGGAPSVVNSTLVHNFANRGAGIFNLDSSPTIANTLVARNLPAYGMLGCRRGGYPCTLSEMDPAAVEATTALSDEVRDRMESESVEAALAWLGGRPDVVAASGDATAIRFRLEGGPHMWVLGDEILYRYPDAGKRTDRRPPLARQAISADAASDFVYVDVVGDDTNGDGKRNNRDKKKALLLAPFQFEFDPWDEVPELTTLFESTDAYSGEVRSHSNADAGLDKFKIWDQFDVVHVSAHGSRSCSGSICWITLGTGTQVDFDEISESTELGVDLINIGPEVENTSPDRYFLSVGSEFFAWNYPQGLDRTVVMFSACETGDGDDNSDAMSSPDAARAIVGGSPSVVAASSEFSTVYLGWSEVVGAVTSSSTSLHFWEDVVSKAWPTRVAYREALDAGLGVYIDDETGVTAELRRWNSLTELYVRDMVTLGGSDAEKLEDGDDISPLVLGVVGDGEPDDLVIEAVLEGIDAGNETDFVFSVELDGVRLGAPIPLASADVWQKVDDYTYSLLHVFPAGRDLSPTEDYTLEAVVEMPGGGYSRYEVSQLGIDGCFWELSMGGTYAGDYSGDDARFVDQNGLWYLVTLTSTTGDNPLTHVYTPPLGTGPSGPYTLGESDSEDGLALLNFIALATGPPFQYETGNSEDVLVNDVVVFTEPPPSVLTVSSFDENTMKGTASGQVWAQTNFDFENPTFEVATWSLQFSARNGLNPDGSPRPLACE
jgi:hypothetical protein